MARTACAEVLRVWPQPVIRVDDLEEGTRSKTTSWDRLMPIPEEAAENGPPTPSSVGWPPPPPMPPLTTRRRR